MALTKAQLKTVELMLVAGQVTVNNESSYDYIKAAAFVFDNGLFFAREASLQAVREKLTALAAHSAGAQGGKGE